MLFLPPSQQCQALKAITPGYWVTDGKAPLTLLAAFDNSRAAYIMYQARI